jgi:hypothetical protein
VEIHAALAKRLRHEPQAAIWEQLCEDGLVQGVSDGFEQTPINDLVAEYRRLQRFERRMHKLAAAPQHVPPGATLRRGLQLAPLEQLVATEAAREEGVVSFRDQVLGGRLLPSCDPAELEAGWFLDHVRGSRRDSAWVHAPNYSIHRGEGVRPTLAASEAALRGYIAGTPQLPNASRTDYELDFLVCLVECLMAWYGWPESGEVERFVLCGETPHLLFMAASWQPGERFAGRLGRITLEVDQAASAAELSRFYKDIRVWLAQQRGVPRRFRSCGQQATDLALHVARYNDGRRWQEIMEIWNARHPQSSYVDSRAFARRARDAYETLCGERLAYRAGNRGKDLLRRSPQSTRSRGAFLRADESPTG